MRLIWNFKQYFLSRSLAAAISLPLILAGCAEQYPSPDAATLSMLQTQFKNGEANLACGDNCGWRYNWVEDDLKADYQNENWTDLANKILQIGFGDSESWYYLGRAAEGLGYLRAAEKYYGLSEDIVEKCIQHNQDPQALPCQPRVDPDLPYNRLQSVEAELAPPPPPPQKPQPNPPQT